MSNISHLKPHSRGLVADTIAGRICAPLIKFSNEHGRIGKETSKGVLHGLALAAAAHAPGVTQPHERRAVLEEFDHVYLQFYTPAGLHQLLKTGKLPAYAELKASFATAEARPVDLKGASALADEAGAGCPGAFDIRRTRSVG